MLYIKNIFHSIVSSEHFHIQFLIYLHLIIYGNEYKHKIKERSIKKVYS